MIDIIYWIIITYFILNIVLLFLTLATWLSELSNEDWEYDIWTYISLMIIALFWLIIFFDVVNYERINK